MSPQAIPPRHQRARPWRWLVFVGLALLLGAWLGLDLLPRLGGRLFGLDWSRREGGIDWEAVEVVWDPTDPRGAAPAAAPAPSPAATGRTPQDEEGEPSAPASTAPDPAVPAGGAREAPPPAGAAPPTGSGAANAGGPPQPGAASGAPAPGRDSPRILQAAWPSRSVLAALKTSGRLRYRLRVEADGRVSAWELLDAGGFDCAPCLREAERIIRELRFAPGTLDGRPVACWVPYEISFEKGGR